VRIIEVHFIWRQDCAFAPYLCEQSSLKLFPESSAARYSILNKWLCWH